jgi:C4-dicarboxylate-specific signal transduction histidine kinase
MSESQQESQPNREELKLSQQKLPSQEKLAALGMLMAGLVHEIRNPIYYLKVNVCVIDLNKKNI